MRKDKEFVNWIELKVTKVEMEKLFLTGNKE